LLSLAEAAALVAATGKADSVEEAQAGIAAQLWAKPRVAEQARNLH
jgi:hypothetical protein